MTSKTRLLLALAATSSTIVSCKEGADARRRQSQPDSLIMPTYAATFRGIVRAVGHNRITVRVEPGAPPLPSLGDPSIPIVTFLFDASTPITDRSGSSLKASDIQVGDLVEVERSDAFSQIQTYPPQMGAASILVAFRMSP